MNSKTIEYGEDDIVKIGSKKNSKDGVAGLIRGSSKVKIVEPDSLELILSQKPLIQSKIRNSSQNDQFNTLSVRDNNTLEGALSGGATQKITSTFRKGGPGSPSITGKDVG